MVRWGAVENVASPRKQAAIRSAGVPTCRGVDPPILRRGIKVFCKNIDVDQEVKSIHLATSIFRVANCIFVTCTSAARL